MAPVEQDAASLDAKLPVLTRLIGGDDANEQRVWREPLKSMLDKTLSRAVRSAFAISGRTAIYRPTGRALPISSRRGRIINPRVLPPAWIEHLGVEAVGQMVGVAGDLGRERRVVQHAVEPLHG